MISSCGVMWKGDRIGPVTPKEQTTDEVVGGRALDAKTDGTTP